MGSHESSEPHIVIVEDDPDVARMLQLELEMEGFRVSIAETGPEGLDLVHRTKPDAVILDGMLPELGGFQVLRRLKSEKETAGIPVIYISARTNPEEARQAVESGAVRYFGKPFEPSELIGEVKSVLAQAGM